jgi:uncharacterized protein (DUF2062 family)
MPRRLLKKILPSQKFLEKHRVLRVFGDRLMEPRLWAVHRRAVAGALGWALAISFIPLPVHSLVAGLVALTWRLNVPTIYATIWLVNNPLTMVPLYYFAYRVGTLLLGAPKHPFSFHLSFKWLQYGLGPVWRPFLLGCLTCSVVAGLIGWVGLRLLWRWQVKRRYRSRHYAAH